MALKADKNYLNWSAEKLRRKADQHWEMAGLARMDGDHADAIYHTDLARKYQGRLREFGE